LRNKRIEPLERIYRRYGRDTFLYYVYTDKAKKTKKVNKDIKLMIAKCKYTYFEYLEDLGIYTFMYKFKKTITKENRWFKFRIKVRRYYDSLKAYQLRKIATIYRPRVLNSNRSFLSAMTYRADAFILRLGFARTPFHSREMVRAGYIFCNNIQIKNFHHKFNIGDIMTSKISNYFNNNLKLLRRNSFVGFGVPRFLRYNFKLPAIIILRTPKRNETLFGEKIDLTRLMSALKII
jgi:ribosomal protein S4